MNKEALEKLKAKEEADRKAREAQDAADSKAKIVAAAKLAKLNELKGQKLTEKLAAEQKLKDDKALDLKKL